MQKKKFSCDSCDAYGTISHEMDSEYFKIEVCPFCGAYLENHVDTDEDD